MVIVDCPFCDSPTALHADASTLDCPVCAIAVEISEEAAPAAIDLASAA